MFIWKQRLVLSMASFAMATCLISTVAHADSVLEFNMADTGLIRNANFPGSLYGSNLPGTPDVALTWGNGYQQYDDWDGGGDVAQLDFEVRRDPASQVFRPIDLIFRPTAEFGVYVTSFHLDTWQGNAAANMSIDWQLLDNADQLLFSGNYTPATPVQGDRTLITTGMAADTAHFGDLTLRFLRLNGNPTYIAVDNLAFGQATAVPEPVSTAVLAFATGAWAWKRRHRRSTDLPSLDC